MAAVTPASAAWLEAKTDHFTIYSEQNERALRDFATKLERYDAAMRHLRKIADIEPGPANRLTIHVVSSARALRRLYGDKNSSIAGFYIGRAGGSIAFIPRRFGSSAKW